MTILQAAQKILDVATQNIKEMDDEIFKELIAIIQEILEGENGKLRGI